jgi:hypothetical protein
MTWVSTSMIGMSLIAAPMTPPRGALGPPS